MDLNTYLIAARKPYVGSELPMFAGDDKAKPDFQGIPQLSAGQLIRPSPFPMKESAGLLWFPLSVLDRKVRLFMPNQRRVFNYVANPLTMDGLTVIARRMCSTGSGYIDVPRGEWLVNTPVVTAEGTQIECVVQDAALGNLYDAESSTGDAVAPTPVIQVNQDSFDTEQKLVVTPLTPVNLAALAVAPGCRLSVKALPTNSGNIYVGKSSARALKSALHGFVLEPGGAVPLNVKNASAVWIDADNANEGVCYGAEI